MDFDKVAANQEKFGSCASWGVWDMPAGDLHRYLPDPKVAPDYFLNVFVKKLNKISPQDELDLVG